MSQIKYNCRFTLKPNGRVFMRVRWDSGKSETSIALPVYAEPIKWNRETQRAIRNTNHEVNGAVFTARTINNAIEKATDVVDRLFQEYGFRNEPPSVEHVKDVLIKLQPDKPIVTANTQENTTTIPPIETLYKNFLNNYGSENNWAAKTHCKYQQVYRLLRAYCPKVTLPDIDKKLLTGFKVWLVEQGYKNSSVTKYFRCLRTMLRWIHEDGYEVNPEALGYKSKLIVPTKNVIYLKLEEIQQFEHFQFPPSKRYLARARDLFCFMCYTSLRYSDLKGLKKAAIVNNTITTICQKTKGELHIPLVSQAVTIKDRYIEQTPGDYVFPVPAAQKLNDFIKEAAKMAGLDREVMDTTFCGNERVEHVMKLYEAISCHDARRTFVCISLSLGIPQSVVMACTGHSDYAAMRPYVAISDETSRSELTKWEIGSIRNEVNKILDKMTEDQLMALLNQLRQH